MDYIIRGTALNGEVRFVAGKTLDMIRESKSIHGLSSVATHALGRVIIAGTLMAGFLKNKKDSITIQVRGDGPIGTMLVISDYFHNTRGYVENGKVEGTLRNDGVYDVGKAVGVNGYLNITMDMGLKEPYSGCVELINGEIVEDIIYYYSSSEQLPSLISFGVLLDKNQDVIDAGGYIIQLMPNATEKTIKFLKDKLQSIKSIDEMMNMKYTPEDFIENVIGYDYKVNNSEKCYLKCNCSREKMIRALISIGKIEILNLLEEEINQEMVCHYCNKKYIIELNELRNIIENA